MHCPIVDRMDDQILDERSRIPLADRSGFLTNKAGMLLLQAVEQRLKELGLSSRPYFVLAGVDGAGPISQQDLSRLLSIDPTTMVALVDELERGGFVQRSRNPSDRRRFDLTLTESGKRTLEAAHTAMAAAEAEFFAPLSETQRGRYHKYLEMLLAGRWP